MSGLYEAVSLALRYWFLIVAVIVLLGVTSISIKEYRDKRMVLDMAQSSIGYLSVISGPDDVMGQNVPLMERNVIGRGRNSDILFADRSLDKAHAQIYMDDKGTTYISKLGRRETTVNGIAIDEPVPIYDRDVICFGNVVVKVYLKED